MWVSPSFLFSCWKTYGKYDNLSNLAGVGLCVTSEQGKLCKIRNAFPTHFPLRQGFSRGVEIHAELPWKSTSFLSQMKSASEPVPAGHTHCVRQLQPILWDGVESGVISCQRNTSLMAAW